MNTLYVHKFAQMNRKSNETDKARIFSSLSRIRLCYMYLHLSYLFVFFVLSFFQVLTISSVSRTPF